MAQDNHKIYLPQKWLQYFLHQFINSLNVWKFRSYICSHHYNELEVTLLSFQNDLRKWHHNEIHPHNAFQKNLWNARTIYSSHKTVWWISKLIVITCEKGLLLKIITNAKFLLFHEVLTFQDIGKFGAEKYFADYQTANTIQLFVSIKSKYFESTFFITSRS